jgi:hypothetical protein
MNGYEKNCDCSCERCGRAKMLGGAVLLTLGGLFMLKEFTHIGFQWPVLLIVIGVVMVWQHAGSTEGHVPPGAVQPSQAPAPTQPPPPTPGPDPSQVPHV